MKDSLLAFTLVLASLFCSAQTRQLTGSITSRENSAPVENATITVYKGKMTLAKSDGTFTISVPAGRVLLHIHSIGYKEKEVAVGPAENEVTIEMETQNNELNEVVVVGYSNRKKSELTSAVSVVSGENLRDVTSNDVGSLLQGKVPGVVVSSSSGNPNAAPNVVIRGSSSITAGADPLTVVDGIIGGTANPNDIESVTVLRDAAATGLYGSRASNGVIIITTKKGKSGPARINVNSSIGWARANEGTYQVMNSRQLYDFQKSFWDPATFDQERPDSVLNTDTDWESLMFHTAAVHNHTLSLSAGNQKTLLYLSGNYYNEEGTLGPNRNEAFNIRANVSHKINDKVDVGVRFNTGIRNRTDEAAGTNFLTTHVSIPWDSPYNPDGSIKRGTEEGWYGRDADNFLHGWKFNSDKAQQNYITGDAVLNYKILKNLTFSTNNRASVSNNKRALYYDVRAKAGLGDGRLTNDFTTTRQLITSNRLLYNLSFNKSRLNTIAVFEAERNYSDFTSMTGSGMAPGLHVIEAASSIITSGSLTGENAYSKGLVQAEYSYDERFFGVGAIIRESSSRFGSNNRAANFYTLGASWILSNEQFMKDQSSFDLVKLRASYGLTGNAQIGDYQTLGLYSYAMQYAENSAAFPFQLENPFLTWEKAKTTNFGFDLGLLNRITLNADIYEKLTDALLMNVQLPYTTGFSSVIRNIGSVRNRGLELNLNTINIKGKFQWQTNFNIAFNKNRVMKLDDDNDVLEVSSSTSIPTRIISVGHDLNSWYMRKWAGVDPANGDPLWEKVTTDPNGVKTVSTTNVYADATLQFAGTFTPKFTGGFGNEFSYSGFTLSAFFNFVSGVTAYNTSAFVTDADGAYDTENQRVLQKGESRWMNPGDIATAPKAMFGGNKNANAMSSRYLQNASYLRLRNVRLSYKFPESFLKSISFTNASIFLSADNLWTGTSYIGRDPQAQLSRTGGNSSDPTPHGGEAATYPISKKLLVGLNLGF